MEYLGLKAPPMYMYVDLNFGVLKGFLKVSPEQEEEEEQQQ